MSHFYTPWKRQKAFSVGIEMWHWTKMGLANVRELIDFYPPPPEMISGGVEVN